MNCPTCGETAGKFGKTRDGKQRYRCSECGKTFSEPKPLAGLATDPKKAAFALSMLLEGTSVRATSRLTGLDKGTILRLMVQAGRQCFRFLGRYNAEPRTLLTFSATKFGHSSAAKRRRHSFRTRAKALATPMPSRQLSEARNSCSASTSAGDQAKNAALFADKLALCCADDLRPHVSTDGYNPYHTAIPAAFNHNVDHGMLIKQYASPTGKGQQRYSPAAIVGAKEYQNAGTSLPGQICTSHIERSNLTVRMQNRRWTRLTNAFSKKWENHQLMFALFVAWYNFCRPHMTLGTTPAVAAGLATGKWSLEHLLRVWAESSVAC